ncbi:MAG: hypothetical protein AAF602_14895, partial [Myxococcota bacterium]
MEGGSRVLLVDDDIALGELVGTYLTAHGFAVTTATTGAEGLSLARTDAPDAILLSARSVRHRSKPSASGSMTSSRIAS